MSVQLPDILMQVDGMGRGRLDLAPQTEGRKKKVIVLPQRDTGHSLKGLAPSQLPSPKAGKAA